MKYLTWTMAIMAVALAACGSSSTSPSNQPTTVKLTQMPRGTADVAYDSSTRKITFTVRATGLAPNSKHIWGIGNGSCTKHTTPFHPDPTRAFTADEHGAVEATATISDVDGIPNPSFIHIHEGPAMDTTLHAKGLICADLAGAATGITLNPEVDFGSVTGTATLTVDSSAKTLTVKVAVDGLASGTPHPNHIHNGSCEQQGPVAYGLNTLNADQAGHAEATTTLNNVDAISFGSWYVNVHYGPGLSDADQFTPITCGNVTR